MHRRHANEHGLFHSADFLQTWRHYGRDCVDGRAPNYEQASPP